MQPKRLKRTCGRLGLFCNGPNFSSEASAGSGTGGDSRAGSGKTSGIRSGKGVGNSALKTQVNWRPGGMSAPQRSAVACNVRVQSSGHGAMTDVVAREGPGSSLSSKANGPFFALFCLGGSSVPSAFRFAIRKGVCTKIGQEIFGSPTTCVTHIYWLIRFKKQ